MADNRKTSPYKREFVRFVQDLDWDWFVTIGIGTCPGDEETLRRLRLIEAMLCSTHITRRYHHLRDKERYMMAVAFEGEDSSGTRHAHVLARVPQFHSIRSMLVSLFRSEFCFLWHRLTPYQQRKQFPWPTQSGSVPILFGRANGAREAYTVKMVDKTEVAWSRFEFVTPPKTKKFKNENLSVIRNRDRQVRRNLGIT